MKNCDCVKGPKKLRFLEIIRVLSCVIIRSCHTVCTYYQIFWGHQTFTRHCCFDCGLKSLFVSTIHCNEVEFLGGTHTHTHICTSALIRRPSAGQAADCGGCKKISAPVCQQEELPDDTRAHRHKNKQVINQEKWEQCLHKLCLQGELLNKHTRTQTEEHAPSFSTRLNVDLFNLTSKGLIKIASHSPPRYKADRKG